MRTPTLKRIDLSLMRKNKAGGNTHSEIHARRHYLLQCAPTKYKHPDFVAGQFVRGRWGEIRFSHNGFDLVEELQDLWEIIP